MLGQCKKLPRPYTDVYSVLMSWKQRNGHQKTNNNLVSPRRYFYREEPGEKETVMSKSTTNTTTVNNTVKSLKEVLKTAGVSIPKGAHKQELLELVKGLNRKTVSVTYTGTEKNLLFLMAKHSIKKTRGDYAGEFFISNHYMHIIVQKVAKTKSEDVFKKAMNFAVGNGFLTFKKYEPNDLNKGMGGIIWFPTNKLKETVEKLIKELK